MTPCPQPKTFRETLAIPEVRPLWIGQLINIAGDFLAIFAVIGIASLHLRGTPAQITGVTISYMLPLALFGPLGGVFDDDRELPDERRLQPRPVPPDPRKPGRRSD